MSERGLKIALAVSVALNVFALAGGGAFLVSRQQVERKVEDQVRPGRRPFDAVLADLDPATRRSVRQQMRQAALAARPDFEAARDARRQATELAGAPTMDAARVRALLEQSREAEMRGRGRLEGDAVDILAGLSVEERKALTPILARKSDHRRAVARDDPAPPAR